MKSSNVVTEQFAVVDVVAAACAAFRMNGFVKRDDAEVYSKSKVANSNLLYLHFYNEQKLEVIPADVERAEVLIEYLKGLSFKAFERSLTNFETNVLKFVTTSSVGKDQLGIAASLPSVYERKLEADAWIAREAELANSSEYVGKVGTRHVFNLVIENIRYIAKTESSLYSCSENDKNVVKFFSSTPAGKVGDTITITGFIKSHALSKYSSGKETMINRVKLASE